MLAKDPAARPGDAGALLAELARALADADGAASTLVADDPPDRAAPRDPSPAASCTSCPARRPRASRTAAPTSRTRSTSSTCAASGWSTGRWSRSSPAARARPIRRWWPPSVSTTAAAAGRAPVRDRRVVVSRELGGEVAQHLGVADPRTTRSSPRWRHTSIGHRASACDMLPSQQSNSGSTSSSSSASAGNEIVSRRKSSSVSSAEPAPSAPRRSTHASVMIIAEHLARTTPRPRHARPHDLKGFRWARTRRRPAESCAHKVVRARTTPPANRSHQHRGGPRAPRARNFAHPLQAELR